MTDSRNNEVKLRLNDDELARLDELRGSVPRAAFVRSLLRDDPQGQSGRGALDPDLAGTRRAG